MKKMVLPIALRYLSTLLTFCILVQIQPAFPENYYECLENVVVIPDPPQASFDKPFVKMNISMFLEGDLGAALTIEKKKNRIRSGCEIKDSPNIVYNFDGEHLAFCDQRHLPDGRIKRHFLTINNTGGLATFAVENVSEHELHDHLHSAHPVNVTALFKSEGLPTSKAKCPEAVGTNKNTCCQRARLRSSGLDIERYISITPERPGYKLRKAQRRVMSGRLSACEHSPGGYVSTSSSGPPTIFFLYGTSGSEPHAYKPKRCPKQQFTDSICDRHCGGSRGKKCTQTTCNCRSRRLLAYYTLL
eukprot:scpid84560/ scgid6583/ 